MIDQLGITPWELLRRTEAMFKTLGLNKNSPDGELITALQQHPILLNDRSWFMVTPLRWAAPPNRSCHCLINSGLHHPKTSS